MEVHADGHPVQNERRFGEERGNGRGFEDELVIEGAVIVDLALAVGYLLRAGAVGDNLEGDFRAGQDAHFDLGLRAHEAPQEPFLLLLRERDFLQDFRQDGRRKALVIGNFRNHEEAGHVRRAGTQGEVVLPFRIEMVRAMLRPAGHDGAVLAFAEESEGVEAGFGFPFREVAAVQETVEHLRHGLGRFRAEQEHAPGEMLEVEQLGVPDRIHERDIAGKALRDLSPVHRDVVEQPTRNPFQGHVPFGTRLEMRVAGDGSAAVRAVIEDDVVRELDGEVQHVRIAVPDGLGDVYVAGDHEVVREDGRPVHQDAVFPAFPAFEREEMLMLQVVLLAQRAAVVENGHPARVRLEGHEDAADGHLAGLGALEGPVLRRHGRPDRQLVMDEFVDVDCHTL